MSHPPDVPPGQTYHTTNLSAWVNPTEQAHLVGAIFDLAPDPMVITDAQGHCLAANSAAGQLFGLVPQQLVGRNLSDFLPPGFQGPFPWLPACTHDSPPNQTTLVRPNGERYQIEVSVASLALDRHLGIWRHISDRPCDPHCCHHLTYALEQQVAKRTQALDLANAQLQAHQQRLEHSETTKQAMLEAIPDLIMRVNRDGIGLDAISGGEVKPLPGTFNSSPCSMYDLLPSPLDQKRREHVHRALDTGEYQQYEQILDVEGDLRYEENRIVPLPDGTALILVRDITARVKAEAALWESEQRFQAIFHQMYQFIGLLSPEGILLEANRTALAFADTTREQVINRPFWQAHWWQGSEVGQHQLRQAIAAAAQGTFVRYEVDVQGAHGQVMTIDFSLRPVFGVDGTVTLLILEGRDLSDRKRIETELRRTKEFLEQTNRVARVGGWAMDMVTEQLIWTEVTREIHGVSPDYTSTLAEAIDFYKPGPSRDTITQAIQRCLDSQVPWDVTLELVTPSGQIRWIRTQGQGEFDSDGTCLRLYGSIQDIDDRVKAEQALAASEERLQLVLKAANDGWWDWDLVQDTLYYSPRWFTMLGYTPDEQPHTPALWKQLIHPEDRPRVEALVIAALATGQASYVVESRLRHKQGHYVPVKTKGLISRDRQGRAIRVSGANTDLTYQKQAEARQAELYRQLKAVNADLSQQAAMDGLTQVANRRQFDQTFSRLWQQAQINQTPIGLILCDIDFFKPYNDNYGHPAGDRCLCQVAAAITQAVHRRHDLVARYGGEEFVILLPETDEPGAMQVAQRIRQRIAQLALPHHFSPVATTITVSMGVGCHIPTVDDQSDTFISQVDAALYRAKRHGRDRYCGVGSALS